MLTMLSTGKLMCTCCVALQEEYVEDLIKRLGLAKSADTIVGDAKTRGVSGGRVTFVPDIWRSAASRRISQMQRHGG